MLKRFLSYRFLLEELTKRDFIQKYKRSYLGLVWSVLSPLLTFLVMWFVFTNFFGRTTPHYSIYLFAGVMMLNFFSESTSGGMVSLVSNIGIFSKLNIPKYMFILSKNISSFINFILTFLVFFIFIVFDDISLFSWKYAYLLYPISCMLFLNIGVGLIMSTLYIYFKDIQYLYQVFLRLLMYLSAVFYRVDSFPEQTQRLFNLNAVYLAIKYVRSITIDNIRPPFLDHILLLSYSFGVFLIGCIVYLRNNKKFMYHV